MKGLISAGFLSGFMNQVAGVGGPAVVLYSLSNKWSHREFVATVQIYFLGLHAASLVGPGLPSLPGRSGWAVPWRSRSASCSATG